MPSRLQRELTRTGRGLSLLVILALLAGGGIRSQAASPLPDRNVPYPVAGAAVAKSVLGIPVVETPDTTTDAEQIFPGKGWRVINTGTLPLFLDRLPYLDLPHQEWAKPYSRGRLKVLYINDTFGIGEAAMLEQRGDFECWIYNVPIFLDWYGKWNENAVFTGFLEQRMKELLAHDPDVIVANWVMGKRPDTGEGPLTLPESIHKLVLEKVKAGAGLVLIPNSATKTAPDGYDVFSQASPLRYQSYTGGSAEFAGTHPILDGVPMNLLNCAYLLKCEPAPGAEVPVRWGAGKQPFLGLAQQGRGRVVAFGYAGQRSVPDRRGDPGSSYIDTVDRRIQEDTWHWEECAYSLLIKAILWSAGKEPQIGMQTPRPFTLAQGEPVAITVELRNAGPAAPALVLHAVVRNSDDEREGEGRQEFSLASGEGQIVGLALGREFRAGLHLVDLSLRNGAGQAENWGSCTFTVTTPITLLVTTDKPAYGAGDTTTVATTVEVPGSSADLSVVSELRSPQGRLFAVRTRPLAAGQSKFADRQDYELRDLGVRVLELRTQLRRGPDCLISRTDEIAIPEFDYGDDWRNKMWSVANPVTDPIYRALGIDDMTGATYPHRLGSVRINARGNFGTHAWSCGPHPGSCYPKKSDDDRRDPLPLATDWREKEAKNIREAAATVGKYGVVGLSLTGENVCTFDSSYDPLTLDAFRDHLRGKYRTVEALNAQWGTDCADWAEVGPIKTEAWKKKGITNFSQWLEFRLFMDKLLTDAHVQTAEIWRQETGVPLQVGHEQSFGLWQHTIPYGCFDYARMFARGIDTWISYDGGDAGVCGGNTNPVFASAFEWLLLSSWCKGPIRGIGGWPSGGLEGWRHYDGKSWSVLFNGGAGMDWYEPSMFLAGYGALLPGGAAIYRATHEIKAGIGKALISATRQTDPVAVWQDMGNEYAGWLLTGPVSISRWDMIKSMYACGIKPIAVSGAQVESGALREKEIQLLYLPHIVCMSAPAAAAVRAFVEAGGTVLADYAPGAFDELGKPLSHGRLDDVFGVTRTDLKKATGSFKVLVRETDPAFPLAPGEYPAPDNVISWERELTATTAKVLGTLDMKTPAPAFFLNQFGKGHALLLNFFPDGYAWARDVFKRDKDRMADITQAVLKLAGVTPAFTVTAAGKPLRYFDLNRFRRGSAWYFAVLRYPDRTDEPDAVTVSFPIAGQIYELRSHADLGRGSRVQATFKAGDFADAIRIYAVLPYAVKKVSLDVPRRVRRGEFLEYLADVKGRDGTVDHVLRIEVMDPAGRLAAGGARNVLAPKGTFSGRIPLALNDPPGEWRLRITDVISGKTVDQHFTVK